MTFREYYSEYQTFEKNRKVGLKSRKTGEVVMPPKYSAINVACPYFADQIALLKVKNGEKYFLCNLYGIKVTEEYDYIGDYNMGIARALKDGLWGFLTSTGSMFISPKYEKTERVDYGKYLVRVNGKWGIVDRTGEIVKPEYDNIFISLGRAYGKKGELSERLLV